MLMLIILVLTTVDVVVCPPVPKSTTITTDQELVDKRNELNLPHLPNGQTDYKELSRLAKDVWTKEGRQANVHFYQKRTQQPTFTHCLHCGAPLNIISRSGNHVILHDKALAHVRMCFPIMMAAQMAEWKAENLANLDASASHVEKIEAAEEAFTVYFAKPNHPMEFDYEEFLRHSTGSHTSVMALLMLTPIPDNNDHGKCMYCDKELAYSATTGTSSQFISNHLRQCIPKTKSTVDWPALQEKAVDAKRQERVFEAKGAISLEKVSLEPEEEATVRRSVFPDLLGDDGDIDDNKLFDVSNSMPANQVIAHFFPTSAYCDNARARRCIHCGLCLLLFSYSSRYPSGLETQYSNARKHLHACSRQRLDMSKLLDNSHSTAYELFHQANDDKTDGQKLNDNEHNYKNSRLVRQRPKHFATLVNAVAKGESLMDNSAVLDKVERQLGCTQVKTGERPLSMVYVMVNGTNIKPDVMTTKELIDRVFYVGYGRDVRPSDHANMFTESMSGGKKSVTDLIDKLQCYFDHVHQFCEAASDVGTQLVKMDLNPTIFLHSQAMSYRKWLDRCTKAAIDKFDLKYKKGGNDMYFVLEKNFKIGQTAISIYAKLLSGSHYTFIPDLPNAEWLIREPVKGINRDNVEDDTESFDFLELLF